MNFQQPSLLLAGCTNATKRQISAKTRTSFGVCCLIPFISTGPRPVFHSSPHSVRALERACTGGDRRSSLCTSLRTCGGWLRTRGCSEDNWIGGSSLMVEGMIPSGLSEVCARTFSLHVPLATRTFVSFVYKPPVGVKISLELKTIDGPLCTFDGIEEIAPSSVFPEALAEDNQLVEQFAQKCGVGWLDYQMFPVENDRLLTARSVYLCFPRWRR